MTDRLVGKPFATLVGKTLTSVRMDYAEIEFSCTDGSVYVMNHEQECCESVYIEDIDGDIQRLVGQTIVVAETRVSYDDPPSSDRLDWNASYTWTFYVLRANLDSVTIRWLGTSNGYYGEGVSFYQAKAPDEPGAA